MNMPEWLGWVRDISAQTWIAAGSLVIAVSALLNAIFTRKDGKRWQSELAQRESLRDSIAALRERVDGIEKRAKDDSDMLLEVRSQINGSEGFRGLWSEVEILRKQGVCGSQILLEGLERAAAHGKCIGVTEVKNARSLYERRLRQSSLASAVRHERVNAARWFSEQSTASDKKVLMAAVERWSEDQEVADLLREALGRI